QAQQAAGRGWLRIECYTLDEQDRTGGSTAAVSCNDDCGPPRTPVLTCPQIYFLLQNCIPLIHCTEFNTEWNACYDNRVGQTIWPCQIIVHLKNVRPSSVLWNVKVHVEYSLISGDIDLGFAVTKHSGAPGMSPGRKRTPTKQVC